MNCCEVWRLMELKKKESEILAHVQGGESGRHSGGNRCVRGCKVLLYPIVSLEKTSPLSSFFTFQMCESFLTETLEGCFQHHFVSWNVAEKGCNSVNELNKFHQNARQLGLLKHFCAVCGR